MWDPANDFDTIRLPNGLPIYSAEWQNRPWQAAQIIVHTGSEMDPEGKEGLAHFLEHVLNENAPLPNDQFEMMINGFGGRVEFGMTSVGWTQFGWMVPVENFSETLYHFGTMLLHSDLVRGVNEQRAVILQEFDESHAHRKRYDLRMERHRMLFPDLSLARSPGPIGTRDSITRISADDLRSFRSTHFRPANMSFVTVGGMNHVEAVDAIRLSPFGSIMSGVRNRRAAPDAIEMIPRVHRADVSNTEFPGLLEGNKPEYDSYARIPGVVDVDHLSIFDAMLDTALTAELRTKRQWTYNVGSMITGFGPCNQLSIHCDSFDADAADQIDGVVDDCIASLGERTDLFEAVRRSRLAGFRMIDSSGFSACKNASIMVAHHDKLLFIEDRIRVINAMTMNDVRYLSSLLEPRRRWTKLVRP